ncbi:MaoC/PaaZ C-terminal domain-containing protein [Pseudonocardia xinjiangensis]|uniref:MaoC/PaaZ C-terminal domain-containing protein n=1 Tax=Pseudonocardia xinjiangensis TaxID=75289 RepID=UPI003D916BC0
MTDLSGVAVGDELPPVSVQVTRADLVRYAGASGDFNPIHWSDRVATGVGLPGVIAHGMLTMALAGRVVTEWVGDPGAVRSYGVRFTRPVVVPDDDEGALVEFSGKVSELTEADDGSRVARITVTARFDGKTVLSRAVAEVRLPKE